MMARYLIFSLAVHTLILAVFTISFLTSAPIPVIENTQQQDIISAVILGDSINSHIIAPAQNITANKKTLLNVKTSTAQQNTIALKPIKKIVPHVQANKKLQELLGKNLLADIKKVTEKQKIKQKQLQQQFNQTLIEQAEQSLRQQVIAEDIKLAAERERKAQGQVNKYKALILQAIGAHWIVPAHVNRELTLSVMIRLSPGGTVLDVQITKTSGDPSLDSSVRAAVIKASPLPVPDNRQAFEVFKQFILKVKPENIMSKEAFATNAL